MTDITAVGERTRVRRSAHLARYDAAALHAIADAPRHAAAWTNEENPE